MFNVYVSNLDNTAIFSFMIPSWRGSFSWSPSRARPSYIREFCVNGARPGEFCVKIHPTFVFNGHKFNLSTDIIHQNLHCIDTGSLANILHDKNPSLYILTDMENTMASPGIFSCFCNDFLNGHHLPLVWWGCVVWWNTRILLSLFMKHGVQW